MAPQQGFLQFLRVPLANHHSTIAPYSPTPPLEVCDSSDQAAHYHIKSELHLRPDTWLVTEKGSFFKIQTPNIKWYRNVCNVGTIAVSHSCRTTPTLCGSTNRPSSSSSRRAMGRDSWALGWTNGVQFPARAGSFSWPPYSDQLWRPSSLLSSESYLFIYPFIYLWFI
jgi:hypothetical protein